MRIGILTYFLNNNHGAYMQAYALVKYMQERYPNVEVELINFQMDKEKKFIQELWKDAFMDYAYQLVISLIKFKKCVRCLPLSKRKLRTDSIDCLGEYIDSNYDMVIIGSDEVWKTDGYRGFPTPFWLNFSFQNSRKCSFAPSSRSDIMSMSEAQKEIIIKSLNDFEYIGVRDEKTRRHLQQLFPDKPNFINVNCDPTFLLTYDLDKKRMQPKIRKKWHINNSKKIMAVIIDDEDLVRKIKSVYGEEYHIISVSMENYCADQIRMDLDPFEWIEFIAGSDFVLTQSFHASVFSIISGTHFLGIDYDQEGKIAYLLSSNSLKQNLLCGNLIEVRKQIIDKINMCIHATYEKELIVKTERKKAEYFFNYLDNVISQFD